MAKTHSFAVTRPYLRERVTAYPGLSGRRLLREIRERGYQGGYTAVTETVRDLRPLAQAGYEIRFETPPGEQAQVDFAHFETVFSNEPGVVRKVWLFSLILGYSRAHGPDDIRRRRRV